MAECQPDCVGAIFHQSHFDWGKNGIRNSLASEGGVAELGFPQGLVDLPKCRGVGAPFRLADSTACRVSSRAFRRRP